MWQRFTERARRVVMAAQEESRRLNDVYVNTEHLLLALTKDEASVACRILKRMDVEPQAVHAAMEQQVSVSDVAPHRPDGDYQMTPRVKRVIDLAYDEARQLSNNYIGTEHLLLALIRDENGLAGRTLAAQGVTLERTRREVMALQDNDANMNKPAPASTSAAPPDMTGRMPRFSTAGRATASAAEILFNREFHKLSLEQQQALQNDGLPLSQLPHTFSVILKVAMEAWNTQEAAIIAPDGRLRVVKSEAEGKAVYKVQTDVTLIATMLANET